VDESTATGQLLESGFGQRPILGLAMPPKLSGPRRCSNIIYSGYHTADIYRLKLRERLRRLPRKALTAIAAQQAN